MVSKIQDSKIKENIIKEYENGIKNEKNKKNKIEDINKKVKDKKNNLSLRMDDIQRIKLEEEDEKLRFMEKSKIRVRKINLVKGRNKMKAVLFLLKEVLSPCGCTWRSSWSYTTSCAGTGRGRW